MNYTNIKKYVCVCFLYILPAIFLITSVTGCSTNLATGKKQLNVMSVQEEIALGNQAMPDLVTEYGGVVPDTILTKYVSKVGEHLSQQTEGDAPKLPWEFTLLDSDVINAFALPGGKVFISLALMAEMNNEAQLAGVLGHEIGHVTARHVNDRLTQQLGFSIVASILTRAATDSDYSQLTELLVGVGGTGYLMKFSRDQESESDSLGMRYMARAGYNPKGQLQVMQILDAESKKNPGGQPEFLSTHPLPQTRIDRIAKLLKTTFADTQNNPEFSFYEDRFQQTARARMDTLMQRNNKTGLQLFNTDNRLADANITLLDRPELWCGICRLNHIHNTVNK